MTFTSDKTYIDSESTKPQFPNLHTGGWGQRFLFGARTQPLGLMSWHPISVVPKPWVITMKTSGPVLMLWSVGVLVVGWLVGVCLMWSYKQSSGKGREGRQGHRSTGFNKSTLLKVPGLDLTAQVHEEGSLSYSQTLWCVRHTQHIWGWVSTLSICRRLE